MSRVSKGDLALCIGEGNIHAGKTCTVLEDNGLRNFEVVGLQTMWSVEFPHPVSWRYAIDADGTFSPNPHMASWGYMPECFLQRLAGPGVLDSQTIDIFDCQPRTYHQVTPLSSQIFPDISEFDRAVGRVSARKL